MTSMEEKALIDAFCRRNQKEALSIQLDLSRKPTLTDSKFGGLPYWDLQKEYPRSSDGSKLMLLAQFNLDELYREGLCDGQLPSAGMLQFFIDVLHDDYLYGMQMTASESGLDFCRTADGKLQQDGFRVVYHPQIDSSVSAEDVKAIGMPVSSDSAEIMSPLLAEYAITLERKTCYMTLMDAAFDDALLQAAKEAGVNLQKREDQLLYQQLSDAAQQQLNQLNGSDDCYGHWMLGYPSFTQGDPRTYQKRLELYDVQLFQMDSEYRKDGRAEILWGDMGVANFLIPRENLKNCDFSDILYSWDCC